MANRKNNRTEYVDSYFPSPSNRIKYKNVQSRYKQGFKFSTKSNSRFKNKKSLDEDNPFAYYIPTKPCLSIKKLKKSISLNSHLIPKHAAKRASKRQCHSEITTGFKTTKAKPVITRDQSPYNNKQPEKPDTCMSEKRSENQSTTIETDVYSSFARSRDIRFNFDNNRLNINQNEISFKIQQTSLVSERIKTKDNKSSNAQNDSPKEEPKQKIQNIQHPCKTEIPALKNEGTSQGAQGDIRDNTRPKSNCSMCISQQEIQDEISLQSEHNSRYLDDIETWLTQRAAFFDSHKNHSILENWNSDDDRLIIPSTKHYSHLRRVSHAYTQSKKMAHWINMESAPLDNSCITSQTDSDGLTQIIQVLPAPQGPRKRHVVVCSIRNNRHDFQSALSVIEENECRKKERKRITSGYPLLSRNCKMQSLDSRVKSAFCLKANSQFHKRNTSPINQFEVKVKNIAQIRKQAKTTDIAHRYSSILQRLSNLNQEVQVNKMFTRLSLNCIKTDTTFVPQISAIATRV